MNWTPVRALGGMMRVPRPGLVHHATSLPSVSAMVESGLGGAQRQKSSGWACAGVRGQSISQSAIGMGMGKLGGAPSIELTMAVWHNELGPSVVELHSL